MLCRSLRQTNFTRFRTLPLRQAPALRSFSNTPPPPDQVQIPTPTEQRHFKKPPSEAEIWENPMAHPVWSDEELQQIERTHFQARGFADQLALVGVKLVRHAFDFFSGYAFGELTTAKVLRRCVFLETVAGVPGFAAAIIRHLSSLRSMKRDYGWIHSLLEEAENERMHLLTFIQLQEPGPITRIAVLLAQGIFMNVFFFAYLIYPSICHRFVGYLEEEAVKTYTDIVAAIDDGRLAVWRNEPAPEIAKRYWRLPEDAKIRDMMMVIRADESIHRDVNHVFASIGPAAKNPYILDPKGKYVAKK